MPKNVKHFNWSRWVASVIYINMSVTGNTNSFQNLNAVMFSILCLNNSGEFGIVYKGVLIGWNDTPVQAVAVKALKGKKSKVNKPCFSFLQVSYAQ